MSKTVIITEKPSVAQTYASVLRISRKNGTDGYIRGVSGRDGREYTITWCIGHLVTLSYPEKYDEKYKNWNIDDIPFLPDEYKYEVISSVKKQFGVVRKIYNDYLQSGDTLLLAGDSAREGLTIQEYVLRQSGCSAGVDIRIVWIDSQTEGEILRGMREAKPHSAYEKQINAGYMRAIEDYAFGINFSRALSCLYGNAFNRKVRSSKWKPISVGRVMTCVLGMVVRREREIRNFKVATYYRIEADCNGFTAKWKAEEGRLKDSPLLYENSGFNKKTDAEKFASELNKSPYLKIEEVERKLEKKNAPLLFNLAELQSECTKKYKISPDETLAVVQKLYEAKLVTYPRTDARVLSSAVAKEIDKNLKGLSTGKWHEKYASEILEKEWHKGIVKSKYVNDKKVSDHYAIIPTGIISGLEALSELQISIYHDIVDRFLAIFMPAAIFEKTSLRLVHASGEIFESSASEMQSPGYMVLYNKSEDEKADQKIPKDVAKGNVINTSFGIAESKTQPPKRYTSGSMVLAMENSGKLIDDEELREQIKGCGIGTSATRAAIIKKLKDIGYISINSSQVIKPHTDGEAVYDIVERTIPLFLVPEMTASWERGLSQIEEGTVTAKEYTQKMNDYIRTEIDKLRQTAPKEAENADGNTKAADNLKCPKCGSDIRNGKFGIYCSGKCGMMFSYYGHQFDEKELAVIGSGKPLKIKAKSKAGKQYEIKLTPTGKIVPFKYKNKDGNEVVGYNYEFESAFVDGFKTVGKCPHCGKEVKKGQNGLFCAGRCGMTFGYYGKALSVEQFKALANGESIRTTVHSNKTGKDYNLLLKADGIEQYKMTGTDGNERVGYSWKFASSFE